MILKVKKGIIYALSSNGEERAIGTMLDSSTVEDENSIEFGSELIECAKDFIADVNTGSLKPRSAVKKFESIFDKYGVSCF